MGRFMKSLPLWAEFWLVLAASLGVFIYRSLHDLLSGRRLFHATDAGAWMLASHEAIALLLIGWFLRVRGWTLQHIGLIPGWRDTAIGICMAALVHIVTIAVYYVYFVSTSPELREVLTIHWVYPVYTFSSAATLAVINAFYEEIFAAGYVITALKQRFHPAVAIGVSTALRILYHLYQGWGSVLHVVPLSLIFGYWYVRTNKLWPLVVAHFALDAYAVAHFVKF